MKNESFYELQEGLKVGTYSDEMLKDLLYPDHQGYIETIKVYRNRPLTIFKGFSPIVYQAIIDGVYKYYKEYAEDRLFTDDERFKMSDIILKRNVIKEYIEKHFDIRSMSQDDVHIKVTIICYLEHLRTILFQGEIESLNYHELDRLESDTLMWGINPNDKYAVLFVKENFELLKRRFEYRGSLNNLSIYSRIMLSYFVEVKMIKSIVESIYTEDEE